MNDNIINVTTLNTVINSIFRAEEHLHDIKVAGEVSGFKIFKGHAYFTLKDEKCQISCTCFNCAKTYQPKDGESVIVKGSVDYYAVGGKLNFNVDSIVAIGQGMLALKLQMLRQKLAKEGLFAIEHKKPIPLFPSKVCVVTSFNGAVIKDIKRTIRRKNEIINIFIKDVKVQGKDAHKDIIDALYKVDKMGFDVIIIARGGGSFEELMPFNEEQLVRAIYECNTPIISAVGHESDVTLCDDVADYRAATPTAAAELIAYDTSELRDRIEFAKSRMKRDLEKQIQSDEKDLKNKISVIVSQMKLMSTKFEHKLQSIKTNMSVSMQNVFVLSQHRLANLTTKLDANSPLSVLKKGYWYVSKDNKVVTSAKQLKKNDELKLSTSDGYVLANVKEVVNEI